MALRALLLSLVALCSAALAEAKAERDLIGWREYYGGGSSGGGGAARQAAAGGADAAGERGPAVLSWDPRIFIYRGLLSDEECEYLKAKAEPRLERSGVVDTTTGVHSLDDIRTSWGMFFKRGEDEVIAEVERRLSEWTMIPVGNGEGIQVLRYGQGQEYRPHFDYFFHPQADDNGGNRIATVLTYLSTPEEGGETVFPNVPKPAGQTAAAGFSPCADQGLAVRPRKGDAVLFWTLRTDGSLDRGSNHGSCPVVSGTKWAATKWFHVAHFALDSEKPMTVHRKMFTPSPPPAPPGCKDEHPACHEWAEGGECEQNPLYMVGNKDRPGACLVSCGRCDLMRTTTF